MSQVPITRADLLPLPRLASLARDRWPLRGSRGASVVGAYGSPMDDALTARYGDLLTGSYDCVDRIVLNAYHQFAYSPGGFRTWWRRLYGSDENLDNTHLMRMAGRFARRVRGWAKANDVPVIDTKAGERKHLIAEEYLATHSVGVGVFLVLVARAPATVWKVTQSRSGVHRQLGEEDASTSTTTRSTSATRCWGHVTIKMSGHPPFGAHGDAQRPRVRGLRRTCSRGRLRQGRQLLHRADPARHASRRSQTPCPSPGQQGFCARCATAGSTAPACASVSTSTSSSAAGSATPTRCIKPSTAATCCSPTGHGCNALFDTIVDRTRSRLDVPMVRTLFGAKTRPHHDRKSGPPRLAAVIGTPRYDLTTFKVHFGRLTLKAYTKGEHVLRVEAITHNTADLRCGRVLDHYGDITARLRTMAEAFCTTLDCVDVSFIPDGLLDELPKAINAGSDPRRRHRHEPATDPQHDRRRARPGRSPPPVSPSATSPPRCTP